MWLIDYWHMRMQSGRHVHMHKMHTYMVCLYIYIYIHIYIYIYIYMYHLTHMCMKTMHVIIVSFESSW